MLDWHSVGAPNTRPRMHEVRHWELCWRAPVTKLEGALPGCSQPEPSAGGLTENDFIMASKINQLSVSDLMPKKKQKFWA